MPVEAITENVTEIQDVTLLMELPVDINRVKGVAEVVCDVLLADVSNPVIAIKVTDVDATNDACVEAVRPFGVEEFVKRLIVVIAASSTSEVEIVADVGVIPPEVFDDVDIAVEAATIVDLVEVSNILEEFESRSIC